jgi:hypothetical protein
MNINIEVTQGILLSSDLFYYVGDRCLQMVSAINDSYGNRKEVTWLCDIMNTAFCFSASILYAVEAVFFMSIVYLKNCLQFKEQPASISEPLKRYVHATSAAYILLVETRRRISEDCLPTTDLRKERIMKIHELYRTAGHPVPTAALLLHVNWLPKNYSLTGIVGEQHLQMFNFATFTASQHNVNATGEGIPYTLSITENGVVGHQQSTSQ